MKILTFLLTSLFLSSAFAKFKICLYSHWISKDSQGMVLPIKDKEAGKKMGDKICKSFGPHFILTKMTVKETLEESHKVYPAKPKKVLSPTYIKCSQTNIAKMVDYLSSKTGFFDAIDLQKSDEINDGDRGSNKNEGKSQADKSIKQSSKQ